MCNSHHFWHQPASFCSPPTCVFVTECATLVASGTSPSPSALSPFVSLSLNVQLSLLQAPARLPLLPPPPSCAEPSCAAPPPHLFPRPWWPDLRREQHSTTCSSPCEPLRGHLERGCRMRQRGWAEEMDGYRPNASGVAQALPVSIRMRFISPWLHIPKNCWKRRASWQRSPLRAMNTLRPGRPQNQDGEHQHQL